MEDGAADARPAPRRPAAPRGAGALKDPATLVAALWRAMPPDVWAPARPGGSEGADGLHAALARTAARADRLAARGPAAGRPAARLLADTARAVAATLRPDRPAGGTTATDAGGADARAVDPATGGTLASPARLRLTRMERWLAARAATDGSAAPAADLCLWVLEHLEAGGG